MNIFTRIFKPKLSPEQFEACFHKLPESIQVRWKRDEKFIIGKVKAGENSFVTQGIDADEFIEMVNDAVLTVNNIPKSYFDSLRSAGKAYKPNSEQQKLLNDINTKEGNFGSTKKKIMQVA